MTVFVYVNTGKQVDDAEHVKVFADRDAAEAWFEKNDSEGVALEYKVIHSEENAPARSEAPERSHLTRLIPGASLAPAIANCFAILQHDQRSCRIPLRPAGSAEFLAHRSIAWPSPASRGRGLASTLDL